MWYERNPDEIPDTWRNWKINFSAAVPGTSLHICSDQFPPKIYRAQSCINPLWSAGAQFRLKEQTENTKATLSQHDLSLASTELCSAHVSDEYNGNERWCLKHFPPLARFSLKNATSRGRVHRRFLLKLLEILLSSRGGIWHTYWEFHAHTGSIWEDEFEIFLRHAPSLA